MDKWPTIISGDLEGALIEILTDAPEIQAFAPVRVSSTLRGYTTGDKWMTVSSEGGGSRKAHVISQARVDVNVFGPSRTVAYNLAQTALAVLFREMGQPSPAYNLRTLECKIETGLVRADDKLNDSARYLFALRYTYVPYNQ